MKKVWAEPQVMVQEFAANEYVAACYKIKCTTPNNNGTYYKLYEDTNGNGKKDSDDQLLYSRKDGFHGCNNWHKGVIIDEAPNVNGFLTDRNGNNAVPVFWWKENLGAASEYHSMIPGTENYETNPNAS